VRLKRPAGCKLDRTFSTQWRVRTEMHDVRTDDTWSYWRPDGMARRPNGWNSGQMGVWTDATLNCSKLLDTDGLPDGKISSAEQMLLTDERPDGIPRRPDG
jgi:hypothetical protein